MPTLETISKPPQKEAPRQIKDSIHEKVVKKAGEVAIPGSLSWSSAAQKKRLQFLADKTGHELSSLSGYAASPAPESLRGNIEQFIGMTQVPTGIIGPVQVWGNEAKGDFFVPLATTEGALVSSYNRGARATHLCGGVVSVCVEEAIQRAPSFKFNTVAEGGKFIQWVSDRMESLEYIVAQNSRFANLQDIKFHLEGNVVTLIFAYSTGEAAGQNMVTICTEAICRYLLEHTPVTPRHWFIESNFSGDKKATVSSLHGVRGKKVVAEARISKTVLARVLKTTAVEMQQYWLSSVMGTVQSGGIGLQGHFANGLAAMFLATGQDVACVAEAANGITRMEVAENESLYISVTLPNLVVGTIGGGTHLPTQRECLNLMGCSGPGSARKLAEIMGAVILGGELSIAAAVASHQFVRAHKNFGRKKG